MPRGKQSGIRYGQKKQQGQSDTEQLIAIKRHLKDKHKIQAKREPYLIFDIKTDKLKAIQDKIVRSDLERPTEKVDDEGLVVYEKIAYPKNPDLVWMDKYGLWILECDGAVHDRKTEKTRKRNELFIANNINLIVVNLADLKETNQNIYKYIDEEILRVIRSK